MKTLIDCMVNGEERRLLVDPRRTLMDVLRDDLDLTGAKKACDGGECGSCTVLLGGRGTTLYLSTCGCARERAIFASGPRRGGEQGRKRRRRPDA